MNDNSKNRRLLMRCLAAFGADSDYAEMQENFRLFKFAGDDSGFWMVLEFKNHQGYHEIFWLSRCKDGILLAPDDYRFIPYMYRAHDFYHFLDTIEEFDYLIMPFVGRYIDYEPMLKT